MKLYEQYVTILDQLVIENRDPTEDEAVLLRIFRGVEYEEDLDSAVLELLAELLHLRDRVRALEERAEER